MIHQYIWARPNNGSKSCKYQTSTHQQLAQKGENFTLDRHGTAIQGTRLGVGGTALNIYHTDLLLLFSLRHPQNIDDHQFILNGSEEDVVVCPENKPNRVPIIHYDSLAFVSKVPVLASFEAHPVLNHKHRSTLHRIIKTTTCYVGGTRISWCVCLSRHRFGVSTEQCNDHPGSCCLDFSHCSHGTKIFHGVGQSVMICNVRESAVAVRSELEE